MSTVHDPFTAPSPRDNGRVPNPVQPDEPMSVPESGAVSEPSIEAEVLRAGQLEVRPGESLVLAKGRPLHLSVREHRLLVELVRRRDRIVSREALYAAAWGEHLRAGDRSVDVYVRKLRVKLARALPGWQCIHTHVGFGYRFSPERSHLFHTDATPR
jgi:DNA-binding response OmpR family regulator